MPHSVNEIWLSVIPYAVDASLAEVLYTSTWLELAMMLELEQVLVYTGSSTLLATSWVEVDGQMSRSLPTKSDFLVMVSETKTSASVE